MDEQRKRESLKAVKSLIDIYGFERIWNIVSYIHDKHAIGAPVSAKEPTPPDVKFVAKNSTKKRTQIEEITTEDMVEIANQYKVSLGFVQFEYESLVNYCEAKGRRYKNYKAALKNFVLRHMRQTAERRTEGNVRPTVDARGLSKRI